MHISSEEDAFDFLAKGLDENLILDAVNFSGWPSLNVRLSGDQFHGSLTPGVMRGFVNFQSSIYRCFAVVKYGLPDARRLTEDQKKDLELSVKVDYGSSILDVDFQSLLEKFIVSAGSRMTPAEVISIVCILAVTWSGTTLARAYFQKGKEVALKKLMGDQQVKALELMAELSKGVQKLSEVDKANLKIVADAINNNTKIATAAGVAKDGQADLYKSFSGADDVEIQGQRIGGEALALISRNRRRKAVEVRFTDVYKIRRVDTSDPLLVRIKCVSIENNTSIDANVTDNLISKQKRIAIQKAEWDRAPIKLTIESKMLDDEYKDAVVIGVEELTDEDEDDPRPASRSVGTEV